MSLLGFTGVYWGLLGFTGVYWGLFFRNCSLCHINFIKGICYVYNISDRYNHLLEDCPDLIYCPYEDYVEKKTTKVAAVQLTRSITVTLTVEGPQSPRLIYSIYFATCQVIPRQKPLGWAELRLQTPTKQRRLEK